MRGLSSFWLNYKNVIPHFYLVVILIMGSYPTAWVMLWLLIPLAFQIIYRNKLVDALLGTALLLISLYFCMACIAFFYRNPGSELWAIATGASIVICNLFMSCWMIKIALQESHTQQLIIDEKF